ncbi:GyrI-like domain-containing protein [Leucobacter allii]|uniref:GyrI-like domain-containing protein n=1 Tax=Leucobacter allii TaxID=2932247 RepID=A0ABY4FPU9_9MICO|nr:GyrI-like domain-containing protein [Leucobacter allii]UOQ58300.1 GyrI-like domain-containing protein [Leucobacter allii]
MPGQDRAASAGKIDFKREIAAYRAPRGAFEIVDVPRLQYLMVDGHGDPNTAPAYSAALAALYPLAYALKFASRRELGRDYVVMPLEGLWWAEDMAVFTAARDKSRWDWTMMIMVPDWIDAGRLDAARATVRAGRGRVATTPDSLGDVRLDALAEGCCVQTLHVGPYDAEAPVLAELHERFIPERGLRMTGPHHEIYLGDPRRVAPDRLRTILRQPVARRGPEPLAASESEPLAAA